MDWDTVVGSVDEAGVTGAILAGGQSRRMGRDKALIEWEEGVTLLDQVIRTLREVPTIDDLIIVGDRPPYHRRGARVVADRYPGTGALGGIATALEAAQHDRTLVVACDMPLLSTELMRRMIAIRTNADVVIPVLSADRSDQGGPQTFETLHAIYRRSCLEPIRKRLEAGELKVAGFLNEVRVKPLDERWIRRIDLSLWSFMNVNRPEDLERARDIWQAMKTNRPRQRAE